MGPPSPSRSASAFLRKAGSGRAPEAASGEAARRGEHRPHADANSGSPRPRRGRRAKAHGPSYAGPCAMRLSANPPHDTGAPDIDDARAAARCVSPARRDAEAAVPPFDVSANE
jgi:hypothetical protein